MPEFKNLERTQPYPEPTILGVWEELVGVLEDFSSLHSTISFWVYVNSRGRILELRVPADCLCVNEQELECMRNRTIGILRCGPANDRYLIRCQGADSEG